MIDDDEGVRGFFSVALAERGWDCVLAASGQEGLDRLAERRFDLVFLDLVMPGMTGAETFGLIRQMERDVGVVIITAYPNSEQMARALQVGPFALMKKPFALAELAMVLDTQTKAGVPAALRST